MFAEAKETFVLGLLLITFIGASFIVYSFEGFDVNLSCIITNLLLHTFRKYCNKLRRSLVYFISMLF